ncbi:LacI family transcriptional regulator [Virgisporangium aliadipatigenens]|uniref:LacI family transcriptional regulator n=1 Tax=Virgisporangium aliadipatigenens TaxID=741659 RepID=A0A8J3YFJ5_9ACTN|nr:LacI family DNA-binding transcriptional regulator [Virgisporangium aliadipatigenens]GIJ43338.1 LacI family transcriptional regulator [Virgisporangium aliadipatigenens]
MTIYEVARHAGVSIATVSRVLRGTAPVAEQTSARVRAAAQALHFTPNRLGRSLAEGRHAANGIVFPDLVGPYYAEVVLGYEEAASELGSSVLILATGRRRDAAAAVVELAGRVDGLVIMGNTVDDATAAGIAAGGVPVVLLAREPLAGIDTIRTRNAASAKVLAAHLVEHGHRRIAFLGDPAGSPDVAGRFAGLAAGLRAAGLPAPEPVSCGLETAAGEAAAAVLLDGDRPDAIVGANDEVALGALLAAAAVGLRVPDDLAVTGWDDVLAARFAGLTTVRQPMRELGATAARWVHRRIAERTADPNRPLAPARRRILPTQLVVRRSCGHHGTPGGS